MGRLSRGPAGGEGGIWDPGDWRSAKSPVAEVVPAYREGGVAGEVERLLVTKSIFFGHRHFGVHGTYCPNRAANAQSGIHHPTRTTARLPVFGHKMETRIHLHWQWLPGWQLMLSSGGCEPHLAHLAHRAASIGGLTNGGAELWCFGREAAERRAELN